MKIYTFILTFGLCTWNLVESTDLSQPYFSDAIFHCGDLKTNLNDTDEKIINSNYMWLLPCGQVINATHPTFDGSRIHMSFLGNSSVLQVKKIDDDDFGIYWCVKVSNESSINAFRHSLNIDGAPTEEYTRRQIKNAIVGAISGGVMLLIILICYVIWYFRCSERVRRKRKLIEELEKGVNQFDTRIYDNVGLELYAKKDKY